MNAETAQQAAWVQWRWNNDLEPAQRKELRARFEGRLGRLLRRLGLTGWCEECGGIFSPDECEETADGFACPACGSTEVFETSNPLNKTYEPEPWEARARW